MGTATLTSQSLRSQDIIEGLRQQIALLQEQSFECSPIKYQGETKEQLVSKLNELHQKLQKSRRLNELLNEELKQV